jgi:hypothetical protein
LANPVPLPYVSPAQETHCPLLLTYEFSKGPGQVQVLLPYVKMNVGLHSHAELFTIFPVPFLIFKEPQAKHFVFVSIIEFKMGQPQVLSFLLKAKV